MTVKLELSDFPGLLRPGKSIFIPGSSGEPSAVLDSMARQPESARGVHFVSNFVPGLNHFDLLALHEDATLSTFFMQPKLEPYLSTPRLQFLPINYYGIDAYLADCPIDLAVVQVSMGQGENSYSLGPCVEFSLTALRKAKTKVALVNSQWPLIKHSPTLPLSYFDYVIHCDQPINEIKAFACDELSTTIATYITDLVEDGSTIQTGIGKIPGQVLNALTGKRHLRIHSGIVMDPIKLLLESGTLDPQQPIRCASLAGDKNFYQWLQDKQQIELHPVNYTHHPDILRRIEQLVAINSAIEVDLLGNCNAEMIGQRPLSGPGGLPDFASAASSSTRGMSIIALPATDKSGKHSRIVAKLAPQSPVTLTANNIDFVITEYGIADLRKVTSDKQARALIQIAAPQFRDELTEQWSAGV